MIWRVFAAAVCSVCWAALTCAAVTSKSDHVTARAFGTEGSKAWGLLVNDTVALNPFGTISAQTTSNGVRVAGQTRAAAKQSFR